jgi:homoserine O-acetyltransferase
MSRKRLRRERAGYRSMSTALEPTVEADFTFAHDEPFKLAGGGLLQPVTLRYALYGQLNEARDNAVLACHALSGSARVADWWPQLFGKDCLFDTTRYCVIGVNVIGSCYGSTGPSSLNPNSPGKTYGVDFPLVTISDMVAGQARLLAHLGIERLSCVIGGSIGGMQALRWAVDFPGHVERCIAIGAAPLSAMGLALNHLQRQAIRNDPAWLDGRYPAHEQPVKGLAMARALAMCSYKSAELFDERFARRPDRSGEDPHGSMPGRFDIAGYLDYQGMIFSGRFDANSYLVISKAMDGFDLARGFDSEEDALKRISARVLLVGISSDWLFPARDVRALSERARAVGVNATYAELASTHGHDGFLADAHQLAQIIRPHLGGEKSSSPVEAGSLECDYGSVPPAVAGG